MRLSLSFMHTHTLPLSFSILIRYEMISSTRCEACSPCVCVGSLIFSLSVCACLSLTHTHKFSLNYDTTQRRCDACAPSSPSAFSSSPTPASLAFHSVCVRMCVLAWVHTRMKLNQTLSIPIYHNSHNVQKF